MSKEDFFKKRNLPKRNYYFSYNDQLYDISMDKVIESILCYKPIQRCFYIMDKFNVPDNFILNDFLQGYAEEFVGRHIRKEIRNMIIDKVLNGESVTFNLKGENGNIQELIAYQDAEGYFYVHEVSLSSKSRVFWRQIKYFDRELKEYLEESTLDNFHRVQ